LGFNNSGIEGSLAWFVIRFCFIELIMFLVSPALKVNIRAWNVRIIVVIPNTFALALARWRYTM
jgi:Flp pilus assembly protein TadB